MEQAKDPRLVEAGRRSALVRWGPPRRLNLGDLTPDQRRLVLALVDAQRQANAQTAQAAGAPGAEHS